MASEIGWGLRSMTPLPDDAAGDRSVLLLFEQPAVRWRRARPGEALYEEAESLARDGAAFVSYIIAAWLPKEDIEIPPDPTDPDYVPDDRAPTEAHREIDDAVAKCAAADDADEEQHGSADTFATDHDHIH